MRKYLVFYIWFSYFNVSFERRLTCRFIISH
jgi:hypothetical protein